MECSRSIENDDGWDQERSPSGKSRGLQYLAGPPESVQHLYKLALHLLDNEFITAGFWGIDEQVHFSDPNEESLEGGLEYFVEFQAEPHHFLLAKPADYIDSLAEHFGLTESLKPVADLAVKLGLIAFQGKYRINADEKKLFTTENDVVYGKLKVPSNWQDFLNKKFENFGISF